jgi:predicted secreted Zn-dependent protease
MELQGKVISDVVEKIKQSKKKKSIEPEPKIKIQMTKKNFERLIKVIENEQKNKDRAFEAWRKKHNVDPTKRQRSKSIQYEILESEF